LAICPRRRYLSAPDRGGVGEGGARRARGRALPMGRGPSGARRLRPAAPPRRDAGKPAGAPRPLRRLPRVVPGLARRQLLRAIGRAESAGARDRHASRLARRRLAPPGSVEPGGAPLLAATGAPLLGLRLQSGARDSAASSASAGLSQSRISMLRSSTMA